MKSFFQMLRIAREEAQVRRAVIQLQPVNVIHDFFPTKEAAKHYLHYEAVFKEPPNSAVLIVPSRGMPWWNAYKRVAIPIYGTPSFPLRIQPEPLGSSSGASRQR